MRLARLPNTKKDPKQRRWLNKAERSSEMLERLHMTLLWERASYGMLVRPALLLRGIPRRSQNDEQRSKAPFSWRFIYIAQYPVFFSNDTM